MTSKEAYRVLQKAWTLRKDSEDYPNFDDINEALYTIKQDLERKEELEKENQELRDKGKEMLHCFKEAIEIAKKYKKAIEIIIREKIKPIAFINILKDYKYHNKIDLPYEKVSIYLDCELTQQEYELLKEVQENEIYK